MHSGSCSAITSLTIIKLQNATPWPTDGTCVQLRTPVFSNNMLFKERSQDVCNTHPGTSVLHHMCICLVKLVFQMAASIVRSWLYVKNRRMPIIHEWGLI